MFSDWIVIAAMATLVGALLGLVVLLALAFRRAGGARRAVAAPPPATAIATPAAAGAAAVPAAGLRRRLTDLEQQLRLLEQRQDQSGLGQPADGAYKMAIKLARRGAAVDDLVLTCGLSRGEAELVFRLHRPKAEAAAPRATSKNWRVG